MWLFSFSLQQIEDLKQTNHGLEEYVKKLLDSKEVVSSRVDDLTSHNEHLCQELIKIDQLAEQLEKEKNFVVDTADKELEEAKVLDLSLIRFFFNWGIVDILHYVSFKCTT